MLDEAAHLRDLLRQAGGGLGGTSGNKGVDYDLRGGPAGDEAGCVVHCRGDGCAEGNGGSGKFVLDLIHVVLLFV